MKSLLLRVFIGCVSTLFSANAFAWTDCQVQIGATFVGQGIFWMNLPSKTGNVYFLISHTDAKPMIAAAITAKLQGGGSTIRFNGDGVNCNYIGTRGDVVGIWIP